MYLFIDTLSSPAYICIFDENRKIVAEHNWIWKQREFDTLSDEIDALLKRNNLAYGQLSGIVVMAGPGGFTGTRVTTLVANSLAYSFHIPLFPITVPEFFSYQNAPLPWIISITKKEILLWEHASSAVIAQISELAQWAYSVLGQIDFMPQNTTMIPAKKYDEVIASIPLAHSQKRVKPIYAKDPNITLQKTYASQWSHL